MNGMKEIFYTNSKLVEQFSSMDKFVQSLSMNAGKFKEVSEKIQKIQKEQLDNYYKKQ